MSTAILLLTWAAGLWLIRRDTARRDGISSATWIPTLWVGILASRHLSSWLGAGGGDDSLEGSPIDRVFFFVMIVAAMVVLGRRRVNWPSLIARNWPLLLFYGYLLVSVIWANSPPVSFKRWAKEFGNIFVALVILTETNPLQAARAVFIRCGYLLIPLSAVYIRYFPSIGRHYSSFSGEMEVTGVTTQKNLLGAMVLVTCLMFVWDWLARSQAGSPKRPFLERWAPAAIVLLGLNLLRQSDSKTSMVCLVIGTAILASIRLPVLRRRVRSLALTALVASVAYAALDSQFHITATVVQSLGRNMTFTGRTDVWRELLAVDSDPFFGTGFMSLWDDPHYRALLPDWVAGSAHNGYIEIYMAGGFVGVALLAVLLLATGMRLHWALAGADQYAVVRFAIYLITLMANFSESNFAEMTPIGFMFLMAAIGDAPLRSAALSRQRRTVQVQGWARTTSTVPSPGIGVPQGAEAMRGSQP